MNKRTIDTVRLYKLLKILVLTITIISVILAIYTNYYVHFDTNFAKDQIKWGFEAIKQCGSEWTSDKDINNCFNSIMAGYIQMNSIADNSIKIALLLPLLFFGGGWLYRYLFPKFEIEK